MSLQSLDAITKASKELYPLITKEFSEQSTKKYNDGEWTLEELDSWKNEELPRILKERKEKGKVHLTKDDLILLMDWKLAKGKFRPALPGLIKSNDADAVRKVSSDGFEVFLKFVNSTATGDWSKVHLNEYKACLRVAFKSLCQLKGVGPATASLMLSLLTSITNLTPPFFSDESFMYFIRDVLRPEQPIKYSIKEYVEEYVPILVNIAAKNSVLSLKTLEQGAWSLKTYHIYRTDRLCNIKLPFEIRDEELESFQSAPIYLEHEISVKRPAARQVKSDAKKQRKI